MDERPFTDLQSFFQYVEQSKAVSYAYKRYFDKEPVDKEFLIRYFNETIQFCNTADVSKESKLRRVLETWEWLSHMPHVSQIINFEPMIYSIYHVLLILDSHEVSLLLYTICTKASSNCTDIALSLIKDPNANPISYLRMLECLQTCIPSDTRLNLYKAEYPTILNFTLNPETRKAALDTLITVNSTFYDLSSEMNKKTWEILYSLLPESATAMSQALSSWEKEYNHIVVSVIKRCVSLVVEVPPSNIKSDLVVIIYNIFSEFLVNQLQDTDIPNIFKTLLENALQVPLAWQPKTLKEKCIYSIMRNNLTFNNLPEDLKTEIDNLVNEDTACRLRMLIVLTRYSTYNRFPRDINKFKKIFQYLIASPKLTRDYIFGINLLLPNFIQNIKRYPSSIDSETQMLAVQYLNQWISSYNSSNDYIVKTMIKLSFSLTGYIPIEYFEDTAKILLTLIEKCKYPNFLLLEGLLSFPYFALNVPYVDRLLRALPSFIKYLNKKDDGWKQIYSILWQIYEKGDDTYYPELFSFAKSLQEKIDNADIQGLIKLLQPYATIETEPVTEEQEIAEPKKQENKLPFRIFFWPLLALLIALVFSHIYKLPVQ